MPQAQNLRVVNAVLTGLAQGFTQADLVYNTLFPIVNANKEEGKIPRFGKEHFRLNRTERAMRAKSNRLNWEANDPLSYIMTEHDIDFPYDLREAEESGDIVNLDQYGTKVTNEAIGLRVEKAAADIAQNLSLYPTGNKITKGSGAKWILADAASVDPILDVEAGRTAIENKVVKSPNVAVFGPAAWRLFKHHPAVRSRLSHNGSFSGVITTDIAAQLLELDKVVVGKALYVNDAGTGVNVWADNVVLAYVPDEAPESRSLYDPSYGYTIRKNGMPEVDKRMDPDGKVQLVRTTDILVPVLCGAEAGYIINDVE